MGILRRSKSEQPEPSRPTHVKFSEGFELSIQVFGNDTDVRSVGVEILGDGIPLEVGAEFTMRVVSIKRENVER